MSGTFRKNTLWITTLWKVCQSIGWLVGWKVARTYQLMDGPTYGWSNLRMEQLTDGLTWVGAETHACLKNNLQKYYQFKLEENSNNSNKQTHVAK